MGPRLLISLLFTLLFAVPAGAEERLLQFSSDLRIEASGLMHVTETIRVQSESDRIRHGIFRDLPTVYRSPAGNVTRVSLRVTNVERDGAQEPYAIEGLSNGKRIRIGSADVLIEPGEHTYRIGYDISDEIGFFASHDEIYWNVNGTGWDFPIEAVDATVHLPAGARILDYTAYTGTQGEQGKDFTAARLGDTDIRFATTRPFGPGENLTIVVTWPKGVVREPTQAEKTQRFLMQNLPVLIAGLGLVLVFSYYMWAWLKVGRDPPRGPIVPSFHPPRGLGPAEVRFVRRMGYDRKCFAAALIDLGVKGAIKLDDDGHDFTILRRGHGRDLKAGESQLLEELLYGRESITTKRGENHRRWSAAQSALRSAVAKAQGSKVFVGNRGYFWFGVGITATIAVLSALLSPNPEQAASISLFIAFWLTMIGFVFLRVIGRLTGGSSVLARVGGAVGALALFAFFIPFAGAALVAARELAQVMSFWVPALLAAAAIINLVFLDLLKAPTLDGRKLMDEIEGFRMYLGAAEANRLNVLNPPKQTPELFEAYLPYALALDVENEWNQRFAEELKEAETVPGERGYSPSWYSGPRLSRISTGGFAGALGSAIATAAASASTAPGSSSGMSGGSSGGGGGGGGGGGW